MQNRKHVAERGYRENVQTQLKHTHKGTQYGVLVAEAVTEALEVRDGGAVTDGELVTNGDVEGIVKSLVFEGADNAGEEIIDEATVAEADADAVALSICDTDTLDD